MGERGILKSNSGSLSLVQRLADAACIVLSLYVACLLYPEPFGVSYLVAATVAVLAFHFFGEASGLYAPFRGVPLKHEVVRVFSTWSAAVPVLLFAAFVTKTSEAYSRFIVLVWFVLAPVLVTIFRGIVRIFLQEMRRRGMNTRTVAIVGATELGEKLARSIMDAPWLGMNVVGFFDDRRLQRLHAIPSEVGEVVGDLDHMIRKARDGKIDLVYVALPLRAETRINDILRRLADTTASVYVVPDFFVFDLLHARWSAVGELPAFSVFETPFYGVSGWLKRLEDLLLGLMILGFISIPMGIIALAVKLTSKGPAFFRQRRYGLNGEVIEVLKFRTMTVCEDGPVVKQATKNDARITKLGAFLRRTSLDELPQFLHVITGKMSIVGPRPHAVAHNELYRQKIQGYMLRHKVKPGITGWAQVNGWRGETDTLEKMERRIEHDLEYIRNWGLGWDLKIIFLTVFGSAVRRNAG